MANGDSYGYEWISSNDAGGPTYNWVEIIGFGGPLALSGDDTVKNAIPIGFDFPYYGNTYNSFGISTNGFIAFSNLSDSYNNAVSLPTSSAPGNMLAVFWDDLYFKDGGFPSADMDKAYSYYDADNSRHIIEFWEVPFYSGYDPNTFQIILYEDGTIVFQYNSLSSADFSNLHVGWQNSNGTIGHTITNNGSYLQPEFAIQINYSDAPKDLYAATGDLKASLNWQASSAGNLAGYYIYRATSANPTTVVDSIMGGTSSDSYYLDTGLENDTTYYYRIRVKYTDGSFSDYSENQAVTPSQINISLDGFNTDWQNINVAWRDPVGDAPFGDLDSIKIYTDDLYLYGYYAATTGIRWEDRYIYFDVDTNSATGFPNRGIGADYSLYFYNEDVSYRKWNGSNWNTLWSDDLSFVYGGGERWVEFKIDLDAIEDPDAIYYYYQTGQDNLPDDGFLAYASRKEAPDAPADLTAVADSAQVILRWAANDPTDLAAYYVYSSESSPVQTTIGNRIDTLLAQSPPDTFTTITGLGNDTTYYFVVTALNTDNRESEASDEIMAIPNRMHEQLVELLHLNASQSKTDPEYIFNTGSEDVKNQALYLAGDLSDAGIPSESWLMAVELKPTSVISELQNFRIGSDWTTATQLNSYQDLSDNIVHGPMAYNQSEFANNEWKRFGIAPPQQWDGIKNWLLEASNDNGPTANGGGVHIRNVSTHRMVVGEGGGGNYPFPGMNSWSEPQVLAVRVAYSPIEPVGSLTATPGHKQIDLTWVAPSSGTVAEYIVYNGTSPGTIEPVATLPNSATNYSVTDLVNGTPYYVGVQVKSNADEYSGVALAQAVPEWTGPNWYVNEVYGGTLYEGSPEAPYTQIQDAIDVANANDTVLVLPGSYNTGDDQYLRFAVSDGGGGFNVKNLVLKARGGPDSTLIDGENSKRLFDFIDGTDTTTQIIGFRIAFGGSSNNQGSAIQFNNSRAKFINCYIDSCTGDRTAAVVLINNSIAYFVDCKLRNNTNNSASDYVHGGAFYITNNSKLILDRSIVRYNSTSANSWEACGTAGVYLDFDIGNLLTVINSVIADNTTNVSLGPSNGAGIGVYQGRTIIINSTIANNQHLGNSTGGAGIKIEGNQGNELTIFNSIIYGNEPINDQIMFYNGSVSHAISYSILHDLDPDDYENGNLNTDPEFASYSLHDRSPAIGAGDFIAEDANGNPIQAPATDIDGNARPTSGIYGPDLGAYENALLISPYPSPPTNVVTNPLHRVVELSWNASDSLDVLKYYVYQSEDSTNWVSVDTIAGRLNTNDTIRNLNNKLYYWFGVTAVDDDDPVHESSMAVSQMVSPEYTGPIWYVDADSLDGSGPFEGSPEYPFIKIQDAIDAAASSNDTVMVLPGTYQGVGNFELDLGPKNLVVRSEKGSDSTIVLSDGNHRHFHFGYSSSYTQKIIGFTLQNGEEISGGAVTIQNSFPIFRDVVFYNNHAEVGGAVHINGQGGAQFYGCKFIGNSVGSEDFHLNVFGGAVFAQQNSDVSSAQVIFNRCIFRDNEALSSQAAYGGTLALEARTDLINCLIANNTAQSFSSNNWAAGGGIYFHSESQGLLRIINTTIAYDSTFSNYESRGGGIYLNSTSGIPQQLVMFNTILWGNYGSVFNEENFTEHYDANIEARANLVENGELFDWFNGNNQSLSLDPQFEDPANLDFTLSDYSPAIGAGVAAFDGNSAPTVDILGGVRPFPGGSDPDLGAYEDSLATSPYPQQVPSLMADAASYSVQLIWDELPPDNNPNLDYFIVYQGDSLTFSATAGDSIAQILASAVSGGKYTHLVTGLDNDTTYYFRVAAHNSDGYTGIASPVAAATPGYNEPIWYVDVDAAIGGDGSPEQPLQYIKYGWDGNANFSAGDTIMVLPGDYITNNDTELDAPAEQFVLMSLEGPDSTTIDGSGFRRFISFNGNNDTNTQVIGFTIQNCKSSDGNNGGAVTTGASPKFVNCRFEDNYLVNSGQHGGAVYVWGSGAPAFESCTFYRNHVNGKGGAVYIESDQAQPTFSACVFDSNYTTHTSDGYGGAIGGQASPITVERCTFVDNIAPNRGGAISLYHDWNPSSGWVKITNSLFADNKTTVQNNSAGGAVHIRNIKLYMQHVTVADNTCNLNNSFDDLLGGAVFVQDAQSYFQNSIFWNNTPTPTYDGQINYAQNQGNVQVHNCLIEDGLFYPGTNTVDFDPQFEDSENGDYRLSSASWAIGAGDLTVYEPTIPATNYTITGRDLADSARVNPSESNPDLGAYESIYAVSPHPDPVADLAALVDDQQVTLSWIANTESDLSHYIVYVSQTPDFVPQPSDSVGRVDKPGTDCTVTGLINDLTYYFQVSAVDSGLRESNFGQELNATPNSFHLQVVELLHNNAISNPFNEQGYPFNNAYKKVKHQSLYLAEELTAAGIPDNAWISGVDLKPSFISGDIDNLRLGYTFTAGTELNSFENTSIFYGPEMFVVEDITADEWMRFYTEPIQINSNNWVLEYSHDNDYYGFNGGAYLRQVDGMRGRRGYSDVGTWPFSGMSNEVPEDQVLAVRVVYSAIEPVDNLQAVPGHHQVEITWDAPVSGTVTRYLVYSGQNADSLALSDTATTNTITITGLNNREEYYIAIQVESDAGEFSTMIIIEASPMYVGPVWYVDPVSGTFNGEGSPEEMAQSIKPMIMASSDGDTILLKPGTYSGFDNRNLDFQDGWDQGGVRDLVLIGEKGADSTIIDISNSGSFLDVSSGESIASKLIGITIQNANSGAIIISNNSQLVVKNCVFRDNSSSSGGAIILSNASDLRVRSVLFEGNSASCPGGAISIGNSTADIKNSIFYDNYAGCYGGAISIDEDQSVLQMVHCLILDNSAESGPGGIMYQSMNPQVNVYNSIFWGNTQNPGFSNDINEASIVDHCILQEGSAVINLGTNWTFDPMITDVENGNFTLSEYSPAIGLGLEDYNDFWQGAFTLVPASDYFSSDRPNPVGSLPDLGPIEHERAEPRRWVYSVAPAPAGNDSNDGISAPFLTIQRAIDETDMLDTVEVAAGTYVGDDNKNLDFGGMDIVLRSTDGPDTTIIDCENSGRGFEFSSGEPPSAKVIGFTVRDGNADEGGAIAIYPDTLGNPTSPTFWNLKLVDCGVTGEGGAIYADNSNSLFANLVIANNSADSAGVAYLDGGSVTFLNNTIVGNRSNDSNGIVYVAGEHNVLNSILWDNTVNGNEIWFDDGTRSLIDVRYTNVMGGYDGEGNLNLRPGFVNVADTNFHLAEWSPMIGAADTALFTSLDYDLNPRTISGTTWPDMGAYEHAGMEPDLTNYTNMDWYVSTTGDDGSGTGSDGSPFWSIQYTTYYALYSDTIRVEAGIYNQNATVKDKPIAFKATDGPATTVVDGGGNSRVFDISGSGPGGFYLEGFTIQNGVADFGAGINLQNTGGTIRNAVISGNSAIAGNGGGLRSFVDDSTQTYTLSIDNTIITANSSTTYGGGLSTGQTTVNISGCEISNNTSEHIGGFFFGGDRASFQMSDCIISGNQANGSIGGGGFSSSIGTVTRTLIVGNEANLNPSGGGTEAGGIEIWAGASVVFDNCTFSDNSAEYGGGLTVGSSAVATVTNSILWGNSPEQLALHLTDIEVGTIDISYSLAQGGEDSVYIAPDAGSPILTWGAGNVDRDPRFVGVDDYHIMANSAAVNAGDPTDTDTDYTVRDMGVYPYLNNYSGPDWYSDAVFGSDSDGTGSSGDPFASIQAPINFASPADSIFVEEGTYYENVKFRGNYHKLVGVQGSANTIVDGGGNGPVFDLSGTGVDNPTVLEGFTITNGYAYRGGGIYSNGSSLVLRNLIVSENTATAFGGGAALRNVDPVFIPTVLVENCDFINNHSDYMLGGLYVKDCSTTIDSIKVLGNTADSSYAGLYITGNVGGGFTVANSIFHGNQTNGFAAAGGFDSFAFGTVSYSIISDNSANLEMSGSHSGGFSVWEGSSVDFINCTIANNTADHGAGLTTGNGGAATLRNCVVFGNTPDQLAGDTDQGQGGTITVNYSDVEGGEAGPNLSPESLFYWGIGNIDADPLFVDAANSDFELQLLSPCVDTGDPADTFDPDGSVRDMGALPLFRNIVGGNTGGNNVVITGDTTTIILTDLIVDPNDSLIVEPGSNVYVGDGVKINILGTLDAPGSPAEPISFSTLHEGEEFGGVVLRGGSSPGREIPEYSYLSISDVANDSIPLTITESAILNHMTIAGNDRSQPSLSVGETVTLNYSILESSVNATTLTENHSFVNDTTHFVDLAGGYLSLLDTSIAIDTGIAEAGTNLDPDSTYSDAGAYYHDQSAYPTVTATVIYPAFGDTIIANPDISTVNFNGLSIRSQLLNEYGRAKTNAIVDWDFNTINGSLLNNNTVSTDLDGFVLNTFYTSTTAGDLNQFTIISDGVQDTSGFFRVIPGAPDSLALPAEFSLDTAMIQLDELTLAVDVYDQFDNLVSDGDTVNWTIVPVVGDGDGFTIVTTPTFTDANGQATVDLTTDPNTTLVVGDAIRLEAESNDSTVQTMLITIVPDDIYNLSMPESLTADTIDLSADVASIVITATMIDTFENPLEGVDISWSITTDSSPDSALSSSITPTDAAGVATVELTTGTVAGYEYWVEAWINEESLMAALNNQANTDAIRVAGNVTTTNKKGSVSTRQITLPVNIGQPVFPDNWDREAIYDLEDTTNVIRIVPGVPDTVIFEIATDTVMTRQDSIEFVVDIFDQYDNLVADSSLVTWELGIIFGGGEGGLSFSDSTSITVGGSANVVLITTDTLWLMAGQHYEVIATCEGIESRSEPIHIVNDDPYNLIVDDAYDRTPEADANTVELEVTIFDRFDYPLEDVPVYWSIIQGTGGGLENGDLLDTTLTYEAIATNTLTTATLSGSEYRVRIWVDNVGGYTLSRSTGGESVFKAQPAASTGKLAFSAMPETPLSVLSAGSRTDFQLDDTTDVITVLPGVPAGVVFDLTNDTTLTQLEALPVAVTITDQYGNLVADSTSVDWVIEGVVITGFVLDTVTSVTTNGIAINVLRTAPTAALGTTVTVKAQSGTAFISSNDVVVVADDPYNLTVDDAYDRLPVADNNTVPMTVTLIDTFENVLDAVPVYWSIIEGTGGSFDNTDLLDTTLTGVGGIATNTLTTVTLSGSEYRVRIWVENVGGYTFSRSIGGESVFSVLPAASTGKLAYSTMPETPLSVLSAGSRTDFYLDYTTDIITVLPGVPAGVVFDLTNDTVMTQLEALPLVVTVTDQYGNMVIDETIIDWTIEGVATTGFNLDQNTTLATNGIGINVLRTDPAAVLGTTVTVKAQSGTAFISSNNVVVVADDPYNLTVDDAYDRTPVADANSVPLSVTIIDTFENVLDAVPVYWSIIEGTGGNFDNSDLLDTTLTGVGGIATNTLTTANTSGSVYRVRIWVENVGGYTFSRSIGGESVFSVLPAASTGKLAFSAMPETPLSVLSTGPRTDFYLDYTTDVITVLPGAPVTITLDNPDKIRYLFQGDQDSIIIHVFDAFDNSVADTSVVNWNPVYTGGEYSIDMQENVTTAGRAKLNLTADQNAPWLAQIDFAILVESVFDANYAEDSITYIIDDKIPPGAVIGLTITPAEWDSVNSFDLSWSNPPEHSGVKGAHYVIDTNTYYYQEEPGIIAVDDIALFENGISTIGVWLEDNAANKDIENIVSMVAKWDNVAPDAFTLDDPVPSATPGWLKISDPVFSWNHSSDATAGLRHYRFELTGTVTYTIDPEQDTLKLDDPLAEGSSYTLSVFAVDSAYNETESNTVTFGVDLTLPKVTEHNEANDKPIDTEFTLDISFKDDVSGVNTIICKYRVSGETDWNTSTKTSTVAVGVVDDKTFTVQSQFVTHTGVEYKFELTDNAGNIYYYPDDKEYYSVQVRENDGFSSTTMWSQGIPNGSSVAAYQLISFPGVPTNTSPHEILVTASGFGAYDNTKWRFFTYETGEWIEFANIPDIEKSKAYFLIVMDGGKNINTGVVRTVKTEVPESVSLTNGDWAFIGNPFNFTIPLENVYDENGLSVAGDENFQSYIGGAWTGVTALEPWQGYIFKSATAQTLFINPNIENGGTAKILDNAVNSLEDDEWLIDITARNGYARDLHNRVGVLHRAQDTYDPMDNFEPPLLPGGISLRIDNHDWPANGDIYTTDIKSINPEGSFWDMEVVASDKKYSVALNFAGLEDLPEEYDIFLIDKSIGTAQNLRGRPDYYYAIGSAKSTRNLRLVAGTRDFVNANNAGVALYPESYSLSQNFPNPFNPKTTILVSIEDDAFVDLVIYNLLGEVVTTLAREEYLPAGYYNYIWAGKNDHGRRVASGIYFYVSRIKSPSGKMLLNSTKKMILVK